jgi:hypothetical protein
LREDVNCWLSYLWVMVADGQFLESSEELRRKLKVDRIIKLP